MVRSATEENEVNFIGFVIALKLRSDDVCLPSYRLDAILEAL